MEKLGKLMGSTARLKVLRLFLFNQQLSYTLEEASTHAKLAKAVAQKEVTLLVSVGLLRRSGKGSNAHYAVNKKFPYLSALDGFIRATTSVSPERMLAGLKKTGALRLVVLSGFFNSVAESQVDLLVVGDRLDERSLAAVIRSLEAELGREISYASFLTEDFRYRLGVYDRLVRDVFDYPHRILLDKIGL